VWAETTARFRFRFRVALGEGKLPSRQLVLKLEDGTYHRANFKFK
jgi:hypothetical protein